MHPHPGQPYSHHHPKHPHGHSHSPHQTAEYFPHEPLFCVFPSSIESANGERFTGFDCLRPEKARPTLLR
jgi:hypothetical protein